MLGRFEFIEVETCYGKERVNVGYVMVLIIDITQPHLIVEDSIESDTHMWKIIYFRHNIGKSKYKTCVKCYW